MHAKLREAQSTILSKESDVLAIRQQLLALQSLRNDDEAKVAEILAVPIDSLIGPNTIEHLTRLVRRITDLKKAGEENKSIRKELRNEQDKVKEMAAVITVKQDKIDQLFQTVKQVQNKFKSEMEQAEKDISCMEKDNTVLVTKLNESNQRISELETLLGQQRYVSNRFVFVSLCITYPLFVFLIFSFLP